MSLAIREYQMGDIYKLFQVGVEAYNMQYCREDVLAAGVAFTGIDKDENIVGCAGLAEMWEGVYEAWIALDQNHKLKHTFIFKKLKFILDDLPIEKVIRVHAHVNINTENQEHLMKFLGFEIEAYLKNYFPKKEDCVVWRRLYQCPH